MQREDALLEAMIWDALQQCDRRGSGCFVGFLDEREQQLVRNLMEHAGIENYMLWGGYDGAERVVFGALSAYAGKDSSVFPIMPVSVTFRQQDTLCHRDFLGALMALGIERSTVGDILVEPGRCVLFLRQEIAPYVLSQLHKVGAVGVSAVEGAAMPYPPGRRFQSLSAVVSSLRTDCVVAACTGFGREKTKDVIKAGLVSVNDQVCQSVSSPLSDGDRIAIRGKGKFRLERTDHRTRKGRICIELKKYL